MVTSRPHEQEASLRSRQLDLAIGWGRLIVLPPADQLRLSRPAYTYGDLARPRAQLGEGPRALDRIRWFSCSGGFSYRI